MEQLAALNAEERALYLQLKDVQLKRKQAQLDLDATIVAEENAKRQAIAEAHAAMKEAIVLDVPVSKLKVRAHDAGLRIVRVHPEVYEWLHEALPSASDEHFSQLLSALVSMLIENRRRVKEVIAERKASSDASYFETTADSPSVYVMSAGNKSELLADYLTAYAIGWHKQEGQK